MLSSSTDTPFSIFEQLSDEDSELAEWILEILVQPVLSRTKTIIVDKNSSISILKGQCCEIFDFWFFHEFVLPEPL
jgi:hypothetical protein